MTRARHSVTGGRLKGAIVGVIAVLAMLPALTLLQDTSGASAATAGDPLASSTLTKTYDGTGFVDDKPSPASSFINEENGFYPGDNGPDDGNVTSRDYVGYYWETKVAAGPARTVVVALDIPEYLQLDPSLNQPLCVNHAGIDVTADYSGSGTQGPSCTYKVKAGQSFSAGVDLTLTAKDTSGTVQPNQILTTTTSLGGMPVYSTDSAAAVQVLSAPAADLLIRPQQCTLQGSCSSMPVTQTESSFIIFPQAIKWQNYDSLKGATATTAWTAQLDVSQMPKGTTYSISSSTITSETVVPSDDGIIDLPSTVGELTVNYVVPANWGAAENDFVDGSDHDFPVHIIVPTTAFSTPDYENNGTGWEPGQGEEAGFPTYNDRGTGALAGYYDSNNDWTMARVYKPLTPIPGGLATKTISRTWDTNATYWDPGDMVYGNPAGSIVRFGNIDTSGQDPNASYRKVSGGTQIHSEIQAFPWFGAGSSMAIYTGTLVLMDTWDPSQLQVDAMPYVANEQWEPETAFTYKVQWSPTVDSATPNATDPAVNDGWYDTDPTLNAADVKSVRVIIEEVKLGGMLPSRGASPQLNLIVPQKAVSPYPQDGAGAYFDTMAAATYVNGQRKASGTYGNQVVPINKPLLSAGLSADQSTTGSLDRGHGIDYVFNPTVSGLTTTSKPINGEATFDTDACITRITLTSDVWQMVGGFTPGTGCMTSHPTPGHFTVKYVGDGWVPANNYTPAQEGNNSGCGVGKDCAHMPPITFNAATNPIVMGSLHTTGVWELLDPVNEAEPGETPEPVRSEAVTVTTIAGDYDLTEPALTTSTPKVEVDEPLHFTATVTSKKLGEASDSGSAVLVMPGRGDDSAYLNLLEGMGGGSSYVDGKNPTGSKYDGSYLVSGVSIDTAISIPGASIECTRTQDPSMDPSKSSWSSDCTGSATNHITAVKITQPALAAGEPGGVSVDVTLEPKENKAGNNYLMWLGPIYVAGEAKSMAWPVNDVVVSSTISGYTYWDASGQGMPRTSSSAPLAGIEVKLLNQSDDVVGTTTTDDDGYYEFANLSSGTYTTSVPEIGTEGGAPKTLPSHSDSTKNVAVTQTYSYDNQRGYLAKSQSTNIDLGLDSSVVNVNFGYYAADPYSDLLKHPAQVTCNGDDVQCFVTWNLDIKNADQSKEPPFSTNLTGGVLHESASTDLYDFTVQLGQDKTPIAIAGSGVDGEAGGWAIVTKSGDVMQRPVATETWTTLPLPNNEKAVTITGGDSPSAYWSVTTQSGKIFQRPVAGGDWTDVSLPAGQSVSSILGVESSSDNYLFAVTGSGNLFQRLADDTSWTEVQLPSGQQAAAVALSTQLSGGSNGSTGVTALRYLGVVTTSGNVYQSQQGAGGWGQWRDLGQPAGLKATSIAGSTASSLTGVPVAWAVIADGKVVQANVPTDASASISWSTDGWPAGERAVQLVGASWEHQVPTGAGPTSGGLWGVITDNGLAYQRYVTASSWDSVPLPQGEETLAIGGTGQPASYWGIITTSGGIFEPSVAQSAWARVRPVFPAGQKPVAIAGDGPASFGQWGVVTDSGLVYQTPDLSAGDWTQAVLPTDETAVSIAGTGASNSSWVTSWTVITKSGGVYLCPVTQQETQCTSTPLPEGEKAVAASGGYLAPLSSSTNVTSSTAVVTESGSLYVYAGTSATDVEWVNFGQPTGKSIIAVAGEGSIPNAEGTVSSWAVITQGGEVYTHPSNLTGAGTWDSLGQPAGEVPKEITGGGRQGETWGVVTASGGVYGWNEDGQQQWTGGYLPNNQLAVAISGAGVLSTGTPWGVLTSNGQVYQRGIGESRWALDDLPNGVVGVALSGSWAVAAVDNAAPGGSVGAVYYKHSYGVQYWQPYIRAEVSVVAPTSEVENGKFTTRDYKLPMLSPGQEITAIVSAKVNRPGVDEPGLVIGNQAWETFTQTERNAPALPQLPAFDGAAGHEYAFGQAVLNNQSGSDTCTATDDWVIPGDQCGQVYAQVPITPKELGSLAGYVFWDKDRDGTEVPSDPMVVGVAVDLYKGVNGGFMQWVGHTTTDDDGHYEFDDLPPSTDTATEGYYVKFAPAQNPQVISDGKLASMLAPGQSWAYTIQDTDEPYYAENESAANADGYTQNVAVVANETTQPVNAGLLVYDTKIETVKGSPDGDGVSDGDEHLQGSITAPLDDANPGFTAPIPVTVVSTNTGSEPLGNLVFTDTTQTGPNVDWSEGQCVISSPASTVNLSGGSWTGDTFTYKYATDPTVTKDVTMDVGATMKCTGTLPAVSTSDFPSSGLLHQDTVDVAGVGTITGTPVHADSPFEVTPAPLPTPKIVLEKGVALPASGAAEGTDCSGGTADSKADLLDPSKCQIESGTQADPIPVQLGSPKTIWFRATNTGDELLLDPTLGDSTTIGKYVVKNITCDWPTKTVDGTTRNYLADSGAESVAVCSGVLSINTMNDVHQDKATVYAVGEVSNKLVTANSEFNAKTPIVKIALPNAGGRAAIWPILLSLVGAGLSLAAFDTRGKKSGKRLKRKNGKADA